MASNFDESRDARSNGGDTPAAGFASYARAERSGATERSVPDLLHQLLVDVAMLFRKELALAASEIRSSVDDAKRGAGSLVTGGAVLYAGFTFLLGAAMFGLATVMSLWLSALIIGAVTVVIGLIMVQVGKRKLEPTSFAPDRTMESLRKDKRAIRRQMQ